MTLVTPPLRSFIIHCVVLATVELTKKKTKCGLLSKVMYRGPKILKAGHLTLTP